MPEGLRERVIGATWHSRFKHDHHETLWWREASHYRQIKRCQKLSLTPFSCSEPLFFDLIEDIPYGEGRVEDGLPQRRHTLGMHGLRTADRDHVSIGSDRPEQTVELVDLVDGDSANKAIVRHGILPPVISRTRLSAPTESIFLFQISEKQI
jgi:hypothetical protein